MKTRSLPPPKHPPRRPSGRPKPPRPGSIPRPAAASQFPSTEAPTRRRARAKALDYGAIAAALDPLDDAKRRIVLDIARFIPDLEIEQCAKIRDVIEQIWKKRRNR